MIGFLGALVFVVVYSVSEWGIPVSRGGRWSAPSPGADNGPALTVVTIRLITVLLQALWLFEGLRLGFGDPAVVVPLQLALTVWNFPSFSVELAARLLPVRAAYGVLTVLAPAASREGFQGGAVRALLQRRTLSPAELDLLRQKLHNVMWPSGLHVLAVAGLREAREGGRRGDSLRSLLEALPERVVGRITRQDALLERMAAAWAAGDPLRAARMGLWAHLSGGERAPLACELLAVALTTTLLGRTAPLRRLALSRPVLAWRLRPGLAVLSERAARARASDDLLERARWDEIRGLRSRLPDWALEGLDTAGPWPAPTLPDEEPVALARRLHGALLARRAPTARQLSLVAESWDRVRHHRELLARLERELASKRSPASAAELLAGALGKVEEELAQVLLQHDLEILAPGTTLDRARRRAGEELGWIAVRRVQELKKSILGGFASWMELWELWADTHEVLTRAARLGDEQDRANLVERCAGPLLVVVRRAQGRADTGLLGASVFLWLRDDAMGYTSRALRDAILAEQSLQNRGR